MLRTVIVIIIGLLSGLYLLNPGAGVFELIPDNIPLLGNLDEASAVMLLMACFRYFNIDLSNFFRRRRREIEPKS